MIIGVLAGGRSSERKISLRSGMAVYEALKKVGRRVKFLDIFKDVYDTIKNSGIDVAFLALHGRFGEDGTIQAMLERLNIPCTGSGVQASRRALDKIASKKIFGKQKIPTPRYAVFKKGAWGIADASGLGWPVVVKPQLEGSSVGLSLARGEKGLERAIARAFRYGDEIMIEEFIDGREITVGILGRSVLPVVEIVAPKGIYDTSAKYRDKNTKYVVPASLEKRLLKRAKAIGLAAHDALGCSAISRVDMRIDARGDIFVLEVNSIPGMTERSLLPKAARAAGISFGQLCLKLLNMARKNKCLSLN